MPGIRHAAAFHWYNDPVRDFCSFLERRNWKFRENHAEANSKASLPALSTATHSPSGNPLGQTAPVLGTGHCSLIPPGSIYGAFCTLLCACLVLEGSLQEAHSSSSGGARLSWERGHPGPPRQRQVPHCLLACCLSGWGGVCGWDWGISWAVCPCTQQVLQGKRCACSPLASASGGWAGEGGSLLSLLWLQVSG